MCCVINTPVKWPDPHSLINAELTEVENLLQPLGLCFLKNKILILGLIHKRGEGLKKFSIEFLTTDWEYPLQLFGVGKYGDDAYRMFCCGQWHDLQTQDKKLAQYQAVI